MLRTCVIALSDVTVDPRPRRNVALLDERGVEVTVVGYLPSRPPSTPYVSLDPPAWPILAKMQHAAGLALTRLAPGRAEQVYWRSPGAEPLLRAVRGVDADLYVTHDLYALPVAAKVARERGAHYAYEAREFYVGQHADRRPWRLLWPTYADRLQQKYIGGAAWVSTVSDGLADWLADRYDLHERPTVVRSVPVRDVAPQDHALSDVWTVLFHGSLRPDRNVHGVIESVPHWQPHLRLVVRGDADRDYLDELRALIDSLGVQDRVRLEPAVPVDQVVANASVADIGVIPWALDLPQKRFALPNKLFEYLAAGLAVVQTGPSESASLVDAAGAGRSYSPATPEALAACLNGLTTDDVRRQRAAARQLMSTTLTWDQEREKLWALYERTGAAG